MARPAKQGFDYFPHDVDSSHDEKIESICALYGFHIGYSTYFRLLERIYRAGGSLGVIDEETLTILSKNSAEMPVDLFKNFLSTCIKLKLFDSAEYEKGILTSAGIQKRTKPLLERRAKMKEFQRKKVSDIVIAEITPTETPQSKVKESKEKKSKVKNILKETNKEKSELSDFPALLNRQGFQDSWERWVKYRKEMRKPMKRSTIDEQLKFLNNQPDPIAIINESIRNGWTGLFPIKENGRKNEQRNTKGVRNLRDDYRELTGQEPPADLPDSLPFDVIANAF
jgi:hypothetical protein